MTYQELLRDLTESYLKSLIAEASGSMSSDFDSFAAFGELGIDSFRVLKIIRKLEGDFGTLPKSLLFENFTINDLANYFVGKHEQVLSAKFAGQLQEANSSPHSNGQTLKPGESREEITPHAPVRPQKESQEAGPIRILENEAYSHPELQELVRTLFDRYKIEGSVSRGTRKIAPNLFIGSARRGYFNYSRSKNIILVYGYTGPRDYIPILLEEMYRYCVSRNFQLNILSDEPIPPVDGTAFSATPFGALQRIVNLKQFTLEGGAMRRLRYQVSKFEKSGVCQTVEYRCGSNPDTDKKIAGVIDCWCAARTMVNPLVRDVKGEILAGALRPEHRLFLTYLDDVLQNVILITAMCAEANGYLMDLEFYPPEMPMGGLEFAITQIIRTLVSEGCDVLSMGGTYGCKLVSSATADPEIDKILDELHAQNIFNDEGNLQFKNKFRPENKPIFLCRPAGSGNPDNVIDLIMMVADPEKMQTSDEENHNFAKPALVVAKPEPPQPADRKQKPATSDPANRPRTMVEAEDRQRTLSEFGFNPLNVPHEFVEFDLKTDSWSQLQMPAIEAQMKHLHARLQQPANVDDSLRAVFPFAHFVLTSSGQAAEHIFFKAWPKKGLSLANLLFPSTIFHQIDNGFDVRELPHPALFDLNSREPYKGNMNWDTLQAQVAHDPRAIAFACLEVGNNAAGGSPVSMQHLREVKALLAKHSIPLVLDGTRVVENAQLLLEQEKECAGKSLWTVVRETLSHADAVIGSLTKDFCVNKGGIIATNDVKLLHRLQELLHEDGGGIDLIDSKLVALSLQNRKQIESQVLRRMEAVRLIWRAMAEQNIPIAQPAGGHCILIDVKQLPEFRSLSCPVASFTAWLYSATGIRAAAHSVGMQKQTGINDLVRLAIPVGLKRDQAETIAERLIQAFRHKENIPELVMENSASQPLGDVHANYKVVRYHNVSGRMTEETVFAAAVPAAEAPATEEGPSASAEATPVPARALPADAIITPKNSHKDEAAPVVSGRKQRHTPDVAIVGMAGRYPKARNLDELWENLVQGRDCIEEIPPDRYERRLQHGSLAKYRGGFIDDVDKFDSLFFNISPREAEMLDPQERLFLEVAWEAIEDAGYYPEILGREGSRNIGVFVGAVWAMYQMLGVEEKHAGNKIVPNSFLWSVANRVSYWLNLSGPSMTVDTACSSSLTALYLACEAIQAGDCSAAIVGGVNLDLHQAKLDINQAGGALSPDGICRSFGKGANGYVAGEGVGALFLKPLDQAVQDGDHIYGVIRSAVVNHGGRTSGYTVPNPKAQANLISAALEKADIPAGSIGYIEAHGTGTELGDPIEITGLSNAFSAGQVPNQTCAIGSIKSNIGHLEAAAGIVGISKVLLQMKHRQLVPSLHSSELNEFIDFKSSPFYVVQGLEEWKSREVDGAQVPLRAGISSFGAGGANAHVILENYEQQAGERPAQSRQLIFPLSARTEDQLRETADRLLKFLQRHDVDLNDAAYTLQAGRKSFDHRLAVIATTKEELIEKLACFVAGKKAGNVATGHVKAAENITRLLSRKEKEEFIQLLLQRRDPHKIAELWVEGLLADWQGLQMSGSGKRVSLPTYPFADKRHWAFEKAPVRPALQLAAGVHPMVDSNESTFERQLFKKVFHDRDFFIYDHLVANVPTLPGVAYLELARKAGEMAAGRKVQKIRNIVWVSPIAVQNSTPKEVFIELKPSGATVRFEVFSHDEKGGKVLHSQGMLLYVTREEEAAEPEYIDLESIRARCAKVIDGKTAYPMFKSFGLNLGPSFQVLQDVYKNQEEILGALKLPEFRRGDLESMVLPPSLVDGSLQAGVSAHLGGKAEEMFVPFSIGEVEILHPLQANCFSYVTEMKEDRKGKKENARVAKTNVLIVDETGKVLVKLRESTGVPLRELYEKPGQNAVVDGFSPLYYSYEWEKAPLTIETPGQTSPASILLFDTDETLRKLCQERFKAAGADPNQVILVQPGGAFRDLGNHCYTVNPQNKDEFARLFEHLAAKQCPVENICFAWLLRQPGAAGEKSLKKSLENGVYSFLYVCQALIRQKLESKVQMLYVYSGSEGPQPHNDAMRGFINTLRLEHPKLICKSVEVRQEKESAGDGQILEAVCAEFHARSQDANAVCYQAGERCIKKLKAFELEEEVASSTAVCLKEKGVYLITGGAGGLGLIFAEFLAKEYKARLVLTGRSSLPAERESRLDEIRKLGAEVLYLQADIANEQDARGLIGQCKSRFGEINGIIHSAGVIRDSLIRNKTAQEMDAVLAPKVFGTSYLDELTRQDALDFFVTFSSLAAVAGNAGQCDYSFANHYMDSFAAGRELLRAQGARSGKTLSLNWSLWAGGGMKLDEQTELYFKKTLGINPLSAGTGLDAFVKGLASERSQFAVLEGVQEKVEVAWGLRKKKSPPAPSASSVPSTAAPASSEAAGDLVMRLQDELSRTVMEFLKIGAADMDTSKILLDLGFDSIGLTTFANAINEKYQLDITPVLFFDYPSVSEIAKYLATERESEIRRYYESAGVPPAAKQGPAAQQTANGERASGRQEVNFETGKGWNPSALDHQATPVAVSGGFSPEYRFANMPIAIVGMSGVMPQSEDVAEFWENLKNSKDMISVIPPDRWRWEDYYGDPLKEVNKSNSKWGGFMKEVDKFDPLFFGISPREAHTMDPQQRIFLETVWKAIEDSGQKVSDLSGTRTGLFVGVATNDYIDIMSSLHVALDAYTASGNSHSVLANRISFLLNLRGPSAPIDTACSSSLVALHRAIESIHTGSCDMAIVGGVQVMLSPAAYISFGMAGMLSSDGKCKTFDKRANGYVRGEGSGAIFLKTLAAAEADGNHIYAVIRATAENHGGRVTTLTAPNSAAQSALLVEAYEKAQMDPTTIGYIECHGTGTSLGDPIEIQALSKAFAELYKKNNKAPAATPHCGLSSVKTNIGHLETAAGIASLLKVLLSIKHKHIPANIHFEELNPYISLKGTPFYVADKLTPWEQPAGVDGQPLPRRAGISSFGFGGANAHIVLEEYVPAKSKSTAQTQGPHLIVLSAKNEDRLKAYMQSLRMFLEKEECELGDLAYTLQVGRDEMPERMAVVVSSTQELKQKLESILRGEQPKDSYRNNARTAKSQAAEGAETETLVRSLIAQKDLSRLAELWAAGARVDWRLLYGADLPKRISAPTYPFARERYWVTGQEIKASEERPDHLRNALPVLHPLIHRNVSTLEEQKFSSRFSGEEFFFTDHVVETQKILPGVAYLEMARAAGELSGNAKVRVIRNLTWERPLVVGSSEEEVEVALAPVRNEIRFSIRAAGKENPIVHCTGKLAYSSDASTAEVLDIAGIRSRCSEHVMAGKDLYPFLSASGLKLGRSFQIVHSIYATESESLAILQLPEHLKKEAGQFWLHPALMDGSLHTAIGLMKKNGMDIPLSIPYSVGEVQIFHPLTDLCYGYATWASESPRENQNNLKANFHLLDKNGKVLVRIKDFVSRRFNPGAAKTISHALTSQSPVVHKEEAEASLQSLVPVWNPVRLEPGKQIAASESSKVLLLGGDQGQWEWLRKSYPNAQMLPLDAAASIDAIQTRLSDCSFDQLLWVAPDVNSVSIPAEEEDQQSVIARQEEGVLALFRTAKALLNSGYANRKLQWTVITGMTQRVKSDDQIRPAHAAVIGLMGSMAKEYPRWDLRLLDVDSLASVAAVECLTLPWDKQGNALAHRQGEWFQQGLALMNDLPHAAPPYRQNGVYVVIGGAGGLGEVWTRFMMENYQADVVWLGRRKYDSVIEEKLNSLTRLGRSPLYISADATNADELEQAFRRILKIHPAIHGVVHSAIVLEDQSIARMDEAVFKASLSAKVDVSVNMDRVFGGQELDFMLFFSSIVSFFKSPGQSNYAAGCTFKDSFAQSLRQRRSYPVKIMNWGYWGNVGIVADESYSKTMAQMGIGSIEPEEGMAWLQALAGSGLPQMALLKTLGPQAAAGLNLSETIACCSQAAPAVLPETERGLTASLSKTSMAALEGELPTAEMTYFVAEILASSLISLGLFRQGAHSLASVPLSKPPAPYYERWLSSSIRYLQQQNWLGQGMVFTREIRVLAELWSEWEAKRALWTSNPALGAQIALLEACLKALPAVLSGKQTATDVMFPNSSMHLVEGIYRGNTLAEYFNDVLAQTLTACIEQQLRADKDRKIRILEIGAGTGGTTVKLLPALGRLPVAEYCYTDVSKAFLMYAEKNYKPQLPALTTAIFDVSKPLVSQAIAAGRYDFVIAANVLHATPDIRETVRNAKAALKNQGVLLLNEISTWSLFTHLTFGLLEGWWLHQDTELRLPGSPGLAPEKWRAILAEEGFESIFFPAEQAHKFGQQIVAAGSNGWVRQRIVKQVSPQRPAATAPSANPAKAVPASAGTSKPAASAERNEQMSHDYIRKIITEKLSEALKMDAAAIPHDAPFADYGVDSIVGVNLVHTINDTLQIELETTKLFEYSTVNQLAQYIWTNWQEQIAAQQPQAAPVAQKPGFAAQAAPVPDTASEHRFIRKQLSAEDRNGIEVRHEDAPQESGAEPIAIIGMSGRFAESESLDDFWKNLSESKNLVRKVSRWKPEDCVISETAGRGYCSQGSFIHSIDSFDPAFFGISAEEAVYMDPQQRLFLEESWKALEDAGYAGKSMNEKQCGVYVGCGSSNYRSLFVGEPPAQAFWGNSESVIPARIAYYLNLQGPAIAVDTACSSSLVTIHLACQGLWARETEMALAGGVFLQATPGFYLVANRAGMLSPEGKCYSFDARANGFVPGEGVGVVVLKRLRDALREGDHIHGVIAGSGINQDGSSNGLIAPNARAQERLERSVYDRFKINPESIQVVEAHGTGTILGDSIEFGAISRAFRGYTDKKQFCAIGTVKTNIGHAATAAGVAGVLKLLLSLKHRQIAPSLHFEKGNPAIDFESSPFYVNTRLKEWEMPEDGKRRAAVSSFGFSGTNAHLVIEEAPAREAIAIEAPACLIVLSARDPEQLRQQARNLLAQVKSTPDMSLNDLSFTLFVGRMHLSRRLSCVARNREELVRLLEQWIETGSASQIYTAEIPEGKAREQATLKRFGNYCIQECRNSIDAASYLEYLATIADLYVQGYSLDYQALFAPGSRRVPLPTYPFARERYWIDGENSASTSAAAAAAPVLHPLLHSNTSTLNQQSYSTVFTAADLVVKDHVLMVDGVRQKVLPAAVYLEMARAAVEKAAPAAEASALELENIVWGHAAAISGNTQVTITLFAGENGPIHYEIQSGDPANETIHCQGRACFSDQPAPGPADLQELRRQMRKEKLTAGAMYAEFEKNGLHYGPAYQAITALYQGEKQMLARLSLPAVAGEDGQSGYWLHPSVLTGALQAGMKLIADSSHRPCGPLSPHALERVYIFAPCAREMFAWVRHSHAEVPEDKLTRLDIDLMDASGSVCVRICGVSFHAERESMESVFQFTWVFSTEGPAKAGGGAAQNGSMGAAEKIELFLQQEAAFQLQKTPEKVPVDQSYFDLGLTSLGIANLIQKLNSLLDINLLPSVLFEYRNIQSLASYIAATYPAKVETLAVARERSGQKASGEQSIYRTKLAPLPRKKCLFRRTSPGPHEPKDVPVPKIELNGSRVLEKVWWQEVSLDGNYEKVTF